MRGNRHSLTMGVVALTATTILEGALEVFMIGSYTLLGPEIPLLKIYPLDHKNTIGRLIFQH